MFGISPGLLSSLAGIAGHHYWRIYQATAPTGMSYVSFLELEFRTALSGSRDITETATGGTPISSTSFGGQPASKAFDGSFGGGSSSERFATNGAFPWYLGYDFGVNKNVVEVAIGYSGQAGQEVRGLVDIQTSEDGTSWTTVKQVYVHGMNFPPNLNKFKPYPIDDVPGDTNPYTSDANTLCLVAFDGLPGSSTFTDQSSYAHTVIRQAGATNVALTTAEHKKFGTATVSLPYINNVADSIEVSHHSSLNTGSGDFTYEAVMYFENVVGGGIFSRRNSGVYCPIELGFSGTSSWQFLVANGALSTWAQIGSFNLPSTLTLSESTPRHVVLQKTGSTIGLAVGGLWSADHITLATLPDSTSPFYVGGGGDGVLRGGRLNTFRLSNVSRYTIGTTFTPPGF